jgi:hypothetical protein
MLWFLGFLTGFFAYKILEIIIINNFREIEIEEAIWTVLTHEMTGLDIEIAIHENKECKGKLKTITGYLAPLSVYPYLNRMTPDYITARVADGYINGRKGAKAIYYSKKLCGRRLEIKSKQEVQETQTGLTLA